MTDCGVQMSGYFPAIPRARLCQVSQCINNINTIRDQNKQILQIHLHVTSHCRGSLEVTESSADLVVGPLLLSDGGQYRCEITYYSVSPACPPVHLATLTTITVLLGTTKCQMPAYTLDINENAGEGIYVTYYQVRRVTC